jgi:hypothetical protein
MDATARIPTSRSENEFSRNQSRLVKRHQPSALVLYENIGSIVAATTHISRLRAAVRRFDTMDPGNRPVDIDRGNGHGHRELVERGPVDLPVPFDRSPTNVRPWVDGRAIKMLSEAQVHTFSIAHMSRADNAL